MNLFLRAFLMRRKVVVRTASRAFMARTTFWLTWVSSAPASLIVFQPFAWKKRGLPNTRQVYSYRAGSSLAVPHGAPAKSRLGLRFFRGTKLNLPFQPAASETFAAYSHLTL
jgi:hypothetical protein